MIRNPDSPSPIHGGDLAWAEQRFGRPADGWIDLSTGINPWPYPLPEIPADAWRRLPGDAEMGRLIEAAASCYGAPAPETVVAAPGTQALIQLLPGLWSSRTVAIVSPTYGEHAVAWRTAGHRVIPCANLQEAADRGDIVVVTNPNNPDGRVVAPDRLDQVANDLHARGGALIVDEAFADLTPEVTLAPRVARPGRLILRSFGKFFGLAGLRLGFAVAEPALADRIRRALGPWSVGGPALTIGAAALADRSWADATRQRLSRAGADLSDLLREAGLEIVGGTDLFALARSDDGPELFDRLGQAGIYVRKFADRKDWLRFGLPAGPEAMSRLREALLRD